MYGSGRLVPIVLGAALLASCENAGRDRVLGVQATGIVKGLVYFDRNGTRTPDAGDTTLSGVGVRLIVSATLDTLGRTTSDTAGLFRFGAVPVGGVLMAVDSTTIPGDSLQVTRIDVPRVMVTPGDSFVVRIAVSFPQVSVLQARGLPSGKKVFVVGVALNDVTAFGDRTVHLADTSAALLVTSVRTLVVTGDSVRLLGTRQTRSGEPTLDNPTVFRLAVGAATPAHPVSSAMAANANGGLFDAALVQVLGATVQDTSTVAGNRHLTVTDGSGLLVIQLDTIAGFRRVVVAADTVGATLDATGVLVPTGAGTWILLPRAPLDVVVK